MITLPTAGFVATALFFYKAKHILENLAYKQKDYREQRKKENTGPRKQPTFHFYFFKRYNSYKPPTRALP